MVAQDASITGLPVELLELIFANLLDPLDLCNASSTCKQLRIASDRLMKDHQALAFRWTTLNFTDAGDETATVWTVLDEILKDQRIRYHIREVNFEADRQLFYDPEVNGSWDINVSSIRPPAELLETFAAADGAHEILGDNELFWPGQGRTPRLDFEDGYDDPVISLLIRQMPNLHELKYVDSGEGTNFFLRFLQQNAQSPAILACLSKLRVVRLEHWDTEDGMDLSWLFDFLRLPSVHVVRGHMIGADQDWELSPPMPFSLAMPKSNVTTLVFSHSCISVDALDHLLGATGSLKSFSYEHGGSIVGFADYDPRAMVAVLLKHAGHSLEIVNIANNDEEGVDETSPYCSMANFKQLKIIDVEWLTLVANEAEVVNDADKDEPLSQGFFVESDQFDPDLAAALPQTIQHLKLNTYPWEEMASVIKLLIDKEQGKAAPDLTNITLCVAFGESPGSGWEELQEVAGRAGVVIDDKTESTEAGIRLLQEGWTPRRGSTVDNVDNVL